MSALDYLDELRARPERERQRLAVWIPLLITLILAILWLLNLQVIWHNSEVQAAAAREPGVWTKMGNAFFDTTERIKHGWQTITNQN